MSMSSTRSPQVSDTGFLEHPHYFPRQMITATELTLEHDYLRDRLRRHNRMLHGWGVVCGARVCLVPNADASGAEPWKVRVMSGYILGPYGDEIIIDRERVVDLRSSSVAVACGQPAGELSDPWCSPVLIDRKEGPMYLAVRYEEFMVRPIRVQPVGCGCDDGQCEYSRWQDGYEIQLLPRRPESHQTPSSKEECTPYGVPLDTLVGNTQQLLGEVCGDGDCPPCPSDPWVVLAMIQLGPDGKILAIDNCSCRRVVVSAARLWCRCAESPMRITSVRPQELHQGKKETLAITATTERLANVYTPRGVQVTHIAAGKPVEEGPGGEKAYRFQVTVQVDDNAPTGTWTLTVTSQECSLATYDITIVGKPK